MALRRQVVTVAEPHVTSMAALVLLGREFRKAEMVEWLTFRDELLDEAKARDGELVCHYCGRGDLVRELPDYVKKSANLATIDHVVPVSKGGKKFEKSNCVVACSGCNQRKADKMPE